LPFAFDAELEGLGAADPEAEEGLALPDADAGALDAPEALDGRAAAEEAPAEEAAEEAAEDAPVVAAGALGAAPLEAPADVGAPEPLD